MRSVVFAISRHFQREDMLIIFEGGCAATLICSPRRPVRCPMDRRTLQSFNDHRLLEQICESYLERYPEERRESAELEAMDLLYRPGQRLHVD